MLKKYHLVVMLKKYHLIFVWKKVVHTYIRIDFPKVENYEERNLPKKESR